jgi:type II secretory pathway component PulK
MKRGFIALITILTVSAIALVISSTILLRSVTEARISIDEESTNQAWATVNACAEYALVHMAVASTTNYATSSNGWNYEGGDTVSVGGNSCRILPIDISGGATSTRLVNASSTVNDFTRKVSIVVATNTPSINVSSWQIVADFE